MDTMDIIKNIAKKIYSYCKVHTLPLAYLAVLVVGIVGTILSFTINNDRVSYAFCGLGTGALASLIVSLLMNRANDVRARQQKERTRRIVLHDLIASALEVYYDVLFRLERFLLFTDALDLPEESMYENPDSYLMVLKQLQNSSYDAMPPKQRRQITELVDYSGKELSSLYSELRKMPRQEYYLQGLLSEEEFQNAISNQEISIFQRTYEKIPEFWDDRKKTILNYDQCIRFLKMTIHTCVRALELDPDIPDRIALCEESVKKEVAALYEQYRKEQERAPKDEAAPDEIPGSESDASLRELYWTIFSSSDRNLSDAVRDLNVDDPKVREFFHREDVRDALRHRAHLRSELRRQMGTDHYRRLMRRELTPERASEKSETPSREAAPSEPGSAADIPADSSKQKAPRKEPLSKIRPARPHPSREQQKPIRNPFQKKLRPPKTKETAKTAEAETAEAPKASEDNKNSSEKNSSEK